MFNLNYILILSLISFTLQDSHCLITDEYCEEEDVDSGKIPTENAKIVKTATLFLTKEPVACFPRVVINWKKGIKIVPIEVSVSCQILMANAKEAYAPVMKIINAKDVKRAIFLMVMNAKKFQLNTA